MMLDLFTYKIIVYISIIVWLFPPIRQYKSYFFKYFLFLASLDLISFGLYKYTHLQSIQVYALVSGILPITLLTTKIFEKKNMLLLMALSISSLAGLVFYWEYAAIHIEITVLIIIIIITRRTFLNTSRTGKINLFHMIFILYQVSLFLKMFLTSAHVGIGITYWSATNVFEIFIAIFFIIYREDSPQLLISLRKELAEPGMPQNVDSKN
jgi:hypothetical protein